MYQQNQSIIYPLPTDALLLEREVVWRVKLPDDYKEFIRWKCLMYSTQATILELWERFYNKLDWGIKNGCNKIK